MCNKSTRRFSLIQQPEMSTILIIKQSTMHILMSMVLYTRLKTANTLCPTYLEAELGITFSQDETAANTRMMHFLSKWIMFSQKSSTQPLWSIHYWNWFVFKCHSLKLRSNTLISHHNTHHCPAETLIKQMHPDVNNLKINRKLDHLLTERNYIYP